MKNWRYIDRTEFEAAIRAPKGKEAKIIAANVVASRKLGAATAREWKDKYRPGGPFHYSARPDESPTFKLMAKHSMDCYKAWMEAFDSVVNQNPANYHPDVVSACKRS